MKKCRITVMKMARYEDLIEKYENPMEHPCDMEIGRVFDILLCHTGSPHNLQLVQFERSERQA